MPDIWKALLVAALLCAFAGCEKGRGDREQAGPGDADQSNRRVPNVENSDMAELLREFDAMFGADFDAVGAQVVPDSQWSLVSVRPRRAGHFVIRHDVKHEPSQWHPDGEMWISEFHIMIGERDHPRYCTTRYAWPLACVGDTIVMPIRTGPSFSERRFYAQGLNVAGDDSAAERDRQMAQDDPLRRREEPVVIRNGVADKLRLLGSGGSSSISRGLRDFGHELVGLLEAREAGRSNVRLAPKDAADEYRPTSLAVAIAPQGEGIIVPANRCRLTRTDGTRRYIRTEHWTPDALILRVGDRFTIGWSYRTDVAPGSDLSQPFRDLIPPHPELELTEEAFEPGEWAPFDIELPSVVHE